MLRTIDKLLIQWGEWAARVDETSPLNVGRSILADVGVPRGTSQARSLAPDVIPPSHAVRCIDRALRDAPGWLREVAEQHYVRKERPLPARRRRHYEELDRLSYYVLGYLSALPEVTQVLDSVAV